VTGTDLFDDAGVDTDRLVRLLERRAPHTCPGSPLSLELLLSARTSRQRLTIGRPEHAMGETDRPPLGPKLLEQRALSGRIRDTDDTGLVVARHVGLEGSGRLGLTNEAFKSVSLGCCAACRQSGLWESGRACRVTGRAR
jgi:hypothetical protein